MKRIKVAQIGVGYWGPNLLRNLMLSGLCEVAAVVEISDERAAFVRGLYSTVCVTDKLEQVLADPSIEAVVVATPANTHYELTMKVLKAGKHVLVEKPMARTVREIDNIQTCAARQGLIAMVGHTFLYNSAVRYLKQLIDSKELGDVRYIYSQRLNLGRIRSDVDAMWNFAPHDISIIQYLLDNPFPLSVTSRGMDYVQQGIDDVVFMDIVYPDKIMAHIHVSWLDPNKTRKMTIVGSKKMVIYDDISEQKITIYDKGIDRMAVLGENMDYDKPTFEQFTHRSGDVYCPKIDFVEPLKTEIKHFIDCIANNGPCQTGPEHAKRVIEILNYSNERLRKHDDESIVCWQ